MVYGLQNGLLGIKADPTPVHTKTIIAGANLIAVDIVGGRKMGVEPGKNIFVKLAIDTFGMPHINIKGDASRYKGWKNVGPLVDLFLDYGEELYGFSNILGFISTEMDETAFPRKVKSSSLILGLRRIILKILRTLNLAGII